MNTSAVFFGALWRRAVSKSEIFTLLICAWIASNIFHLYTLFYTLSVFLRFLFFLIIILTSTYMTIGKYVDFFIRQISQRCLIRLIAFPDVPPFPLFQRFRLPTFSALQRIPPFSPSRAFYFFHFPTYFIFFTVMRFLFFPAGERAAVVLAGDRIPDGKLCWKEK